MTNLAQLIERICKANQHGYDNELKELHEFLMDLRDQVESNVSGSTYNKLDDFIDYIAYINGDNDEFIEELEE